MDSSTRSQSRAVSSMRVPVGARICKVELTTVNLGEKVLADQGNQQKRSGGGAHKTHSDSQARWSKTGPQPALVPPAEPFESMLKSNLLPRQKVGLGFGFQIAVRVVLVAA